jgi:hypothetical protein
VGQNVDPSEAGEDSVGCLLCGIQAVERSRECSEIWMAEVGLLDFRREANHDETGVQQGFRDVRSEATVGSSD